jgi:hypothetical protein
MGSIFINFISLYLRGKNKWQRSKSIDYWIIHCCQVIWNVYVLNLECYFGICLSFKSQQNLSFFEKDSLSYVQKVYVDIETQRNENENDFDMKTFSQ